MAVLGQPRSMRRHRPARIRARRSVAHSILLFPPVLNQVLPSTLRRRAPARPRATQRTKCRSKATPDNSSSPIKRTATIPSGEEKRSFRLSATSWQTPRLSPRCAIAEPVRKRTLEKYSGADGFKNIPVAKYIRKKCIPPERDEPERGCPFKRSGGSHRPYVLRLTETCLGPRLRAGPRGITTRYSAPVSGNGCFCAATRAISQ